MTYCGRKDYWTWRYNKIKQKKITTLVMINIKQKNIYEKHIWGWQERREDLKNIWQNNWQIFSKFDEKYNPTDPRSFINLKQNEHEGATSKHLTIKFIKIVKNMKY